MDEKTYKKMEAKVRRMVDPKKRSGKLSACDEIRKKWKESTESRKKLVLEMVKCGGDKASMPLTLCSNSLPCLSVSAPWFGRQSSRPE